MSYAPTGFRPLATGSWGGRGDWRGTINVGVPDLALPVMDPQMLKPGYRGQIGSVIYRSLGVSKAFVVTGVTKDSTGAILASCRVELFTTNSDLFQDSTTSDANGNFTLHSANPANGPFFLVAYKAGAPDVAGTSVNTLTAA